MFNRIKYSETGLPKLLQDHKIDTVYVGGLALDYCVKYTALDIVSQYFETYVLSDATKPVTDETGRQAIAELSKAGVGFVETIWLMTERPCRSTNESS